MNRAHGGKNAEGTWQWLLGLMPTHGRYVEPFVRSGALLRRKVPALESVVCDLDDDVVAHWRRVKFPGVVVHHGCGIAWLREHADELDADALVYADPPYLPETRVRKKLYKHEMTVADHVELLRVLRSLRCRVMLSGYASKLYDDALAGWARHEREVMTRGHTWRTEILWCNFSPADVVDYVPRRPGRDHRERDRIRKRLLRWSGKFAGMPDYERRAVLAALLRAEQAAR